MANTNVKINLEGTRNPTEQEYLEYSNTKARISQRVSDAFCMMQIEKAYTTGLLMDGDKIVDENDPNVANSEETRRIFIDDEARDFLERYFSDGARIYSEMTGLFNQIFQDEHEVKLVDLDSWDILKNNAQLSDITSSTCAQIYMYKKSKQPNEPKKVRAVLTYPGMKSVTRSIVKLAKNGKYYNDYMKKRIELRKENWEDNIAYEQALEHLSRPVTQMNDILRISISLENYSTLVRWKENALKSTDFKINPAKIKDKFYNNDVTQAHRINSKNFRNMVLYVHIPGGLIVEVQLKVRDLELVDKLTHPFYETLRIKKENLDKLELEVQSRNARADHTIGIRRLQKEINQLEMIIQNINRYGIEKHNQKLLSRVAEKETEFRKEGIRPQEDGTYLQSQEFLEKNFLIRAKQDLLEEKPLRNLPKSLMRMYVKYRRGDRLLPEAQMANDFAKIFAFYEKNPELQDLLTDYTQEQLEVFNRYKKILAPKYRSVIRDTNKAAICVQRKELAERSSY